MKIAPNRVAVYLTAAAGLMTALAPVVANLDLTSTVGVVGGFAGITAVVHKWLDGWAAYEYTAASHGDADPQVDVQAMEIDRPAKDLGDKGSP